MTVGSISTMPFQGASKPNATGSPDNRLADIARILADESGAFSMKDKANAMRVKREINFSGQIFDYSLEDRKAYVEAWRNSDYRQKHQEIVEKYGAALDRAMPSGPNASTSQKIQASIDALNSLTPEERALVPNFDGRLEHATAERGLFQTLEAREQAGAYKPGTPLEDVTDPEAKMALELLEAVNEAYKSTYYMGTPENSSAVRSALDRVKEFTGDGSAGGSSSGRWQDTVTLSPEAQRIMGAG